MELTKNKYVNVLILFALMVLAVSMVLLASHWVKDSNGNTKLTPFGIGAATATPLTK